MLFIAAGSFILLVAVAYLIAAPVLRHDPVDQDARAENLAARKDHLLADIRDLDADLATGKLDIEDHRRLRSATMVEAADILHAMERADAARSADGDRTDGLERAVLGRVVAPADAPDEEDEELEALIAQRRRELENRTCPGCDAACEPADAFCRRCGMHLMGAASVGRSR